MTSPTQFYHKLKLYCRCGHITKLDNCNMSITEVIITSILKGFDHKIQWCSWFKFNNMGLALGMVLKFYTNVAKDLRLNVKTFGGLIPTSVEIAGSKLEVGGIFVHPILNRFKEALHVLFVASLNKISIRVSSY